MVGIKRLLLDGQKDDQSSALNEGSRGPSPIPKPEEGSDVGQASREVRGNFDSLCLARFIVQAFLSSLGLLQYEHS